MESYILGLDLGLLHGAMACSSRREPQILWDAANKPLIPMVVTVTLDGEPVAGRAAQILTRHDPENRLDLLMLLLGRRLDDPFLQPHLNQVTCPLKMDANGETSAILRGQRYPLPRAMAFLLAQLRQTAETTLGEPASGVVVTHPGWFDRLQWIALMEAARLARIENIHVVGRANACAAGAGLLRNKKPETALVIHLDGAEVEATILRSTAGGTEIYTRAGQVSIESGTNALPLDPVSWSSGLTPSQSRLVVEKCLQAIQLALSNTSLKPGQMGSVVLAGMGGRLPMLQQEIRRMFGRRMLPVSPDPEFLAVRGAVLWAQMSNGNDKLRSIQNPQDTRPVELTCPHCGELNKGTEESCWFCHQPLYQIPDPGSLPAPLGIQVEGDRMAVILPAGSELPTPAPALGIYQVSRAAPGSLEVPLYSGFHTLASRNEYLGSVVLAAKQPIQAGTEVVVGLMVNQDGSLHAALWLQSDPLERGTAILAWKHATPGSTPPPPPPLISVMEPIPPQEDSTLSF